MICIGDVERSPFTLCGRLTGRVDHVVPELLERATCPDCRAAERSGETLLESDLERRPAPGPDGPARARCASGGAGTPPARRPGVAVACGWARARAWRVPAAGGLDGDRDQPFAWGGPRYRGRPGPADGRGCVGMSRRRRGPSLADLQDEAIRAVNERWREEHGLDAWLDELHAGEAVLLRELENETRGLPKRCTWVRGRAGRIYLVPGCETALFDPHDCSCDRLEAELEKLGGRLREARATIARLQADDVLEGPAGTWSTLRVMRYRRWRRR